MGIWYTTREDVMSAQDIKAAAYTARDIDRAIESGARDAESLVHRVCYPWTGSRSFDYPTRGVPSWRVWFGEFGLITPTAVSNNDGTTVSLSNVILQPQSGPPYDHADINRGTTSVFSSGTTSQRAVTFTGLWGYTNDEDTAGLAAEPMDASETGMDCATLVNVGVGSVLRLDSERMVVTEKGWLTTGQTTSLAAQQNVQTIAVSSGPAFSPGELLIVDAERMRIVDVVGNNLVVKRAVDGSTLATHTSATIYAQRLLTVQRGALGTTAATHVDASTIYRWVPPGPLAELNLAYAVDHLLQRQTGYARTAGEGDSERELTGRAIRSLENRARNAMGRQARTAAI